MPKYRIQDTPLLFGREGKGLPKLYAPGEIIDLSAEEAERIGANVVRLPAEAKRNAPPKTGAENSGEENGKKG